MHLAYHANDGVSDFHRIILHVLSTLVAEFRGHQFLQACRQGDVSRAKKLFNSETLAFVDPLTGNTALVRCGEVELSLFFLCAFIITSACDVCGLIDAARSQCRTPVGALYMWGFFASLRHPE